MNSKKDPIAELIERSGNNFHCQVINFLRAAAWTVLISPYYNDNFTDKPREIDIVAEKEFVVNNNFDQFLGMLNVKLFIECKFINKDIIFWLDEKDKEKANERVERDTSIQYLNENSHHYLKNGKVAKLFSSSPEKSLDNELIYKAINQSLNAMVYYKNSRSILPGRRENIQKILNYPLIICNTFDRFYKVEIGNAVYSKMDDNFQLEINYAYLDKDKNNQADYFLIDVIDFSNGGFTKFLKDLEAVDLRTIKSKINQEEWGRSREI